MTCELVNCISLSLIILTTVVDVVTDEGASPLCLSMVVVFKCLIPYGTFPRCVFHIDFDWVCIMRWEAETFLVLRCLCGVLPSNMFSPANTCVFIFTVCWHNPSWPFHCNLSACVTKLYTPDSLGWRCWHADLSVWNIILILLRSCWCIQHPSACVMWDRSDSCCVSFSYSPQWNTNWVHLVDQGGFQQGQPNKWKKENCTLLMTIIN